MSSPKGKAAGRQARAASSKKQQPASSAKRGAKKDGAGGCCCGHSGAKPKKIKVKATSLSKQAWARSQTATATKSGQQGLHDAAPTGAAHLGGEPEPVAAAGADGALLGKRHAAKAAREDARIVRNAKPPFAFDWGDADEYEIDFQAVLGEGSYGKVYRASKTSTDEDVVIKVFKKEKFNKDRVKLEADVLAEIADGPNVLRLLDMLFVRQTGDVMMATEFFDATPHDELVRTIDYAGLLAYFSQLLQALKFAHGKGVLHRDVKGANVLFNADRRQLRLIDWGFGVHVAVPMIDWPGTRWFKSPELFVCAAHAHFCTRSLHARTHEHHCSTPLTRGLLTCFVVVLALARCVALLLVLPLLSRAPFARFFVAFCTRTITMALSISGQLVCCWARFCSA